MSLCYPSEALEALLHKIVSYKPTDNVIDFVEPQEMEKILTEKMSKQHNPKELEEITDFVLKKCVNTSHTLFVNQLYGAMHPVGLAGAYILEKMNTNQHTYEVAPVFVITERLVLKELRKLFFGSEEGDGIFAPGGSMANMYGMVLARHRKFPNVKKQGLFNLPQMVVYTSEDSHYSVTKSANWMGFGMDNVVKVKTSKEGAMIPSELETAIERSKNEGKIPLIVMSTAGTTVLGAFDPFQEIAEICQTHSIWLHCDAAWGGSFIFSERLKQKWLSGIEKCDSICWNAHKMLGAPLQCSAFFTKEPDVLSACNSLTASYLFQQDKFYPPEYDVGGDKSFQCGRKPDAFKLWFMWTAIGTDGFRDLVENVENCAKYFADSIREREDFLLYLDGHQCTNVFFWYIPPRLSNAERDADWYEELGKVTAKMKELMVFDGSMMVGYSPIPHKNIPNAIRLVLAANPQKTSKDMDTIIENLVKFGRDL